MTVYVVVQVKLHDKAWLRAYNEAVPAIVRSYGGEYLAVGKAVETIEGDAAAPDRIGILVYPDMAALKACLASPEYAPYRQSRLGPAETTITAFEAL